jgi:GTP-binding protein EngB required for normal cell division
VKELLVELYQMVVIGATNAGKSTFLHNSTGMRNFFNMSAMRETANIWRFKQVFMRQQPDAIFAFNEIEKHPDGTPAGTMNMLYHSVEEIVGQI